MVYGHVKILLCGLLFPVCVCVCVRKKASVCNHMSVQVTRVRVCVVVTKFRGRVTMFVFLHLRKKRKNLTSFCLQLFDSPPPRTETFRLDLSAAVLGDQKTQALFWSAWMWWLTPGQGLPWLIRPLFGGKMFPRVKTISCGGNSRICPAVPLRIARLPLRSEQNSQPLFPAYRFTLSATDICQKQCPLCLQSLCFSYQALAWERAPIKQGTMIYPAHVPSSVL